MPKEISRKLTQTYLELRADGGVTEIELTPEFWPQLMSGKRETAGRLIMAADMTEDMAHWEMHPAGDEVLLLLSGQVTIVLERPGQNEEIDLKAGETFVVPRGCWHRVKLCEAGQMVFMTLGEGTEHKPL
ncbi:cupin domain-containing protein [Pelagibius litoralis]|uniref:Cupin domain-containing protein n=1 Tax=Pelagibius litoralis TaxID=374515 RepID=A0A967CCJ7_9PROT|nr:cupin domain-containing protein [Pelagibius litoralis]NIA69089.1 cupin domain-containing protein [Pelagibius litoralis]